MKINVCCIRERGELLIKVSCVLFSNQNCIRKAKVRYSECLVRQEKLSSSVMFLYRSFL